MVNQVKGLSLIELMVTIAIMTILMAMATLAYRAFIVQGALHQARSDLVATLEKAKAQSLTGSPHGVVFDSNRQYRLVRLREAGFCSKTTTTACTQNSDCPGEFCMMGNLRREAGESLDLLETHDTGNLVRLAWSRSSDVVEPCTGTGDDELWFDRRGVPRCSNWGLGMSRITLSAGSTTMDVTLTRPGKIQYE